MADRWKKPRKFDRNLIVIGAGAAGLVTSYIAALVRAKVTLVEAGEMGGDCLNTGCVPSKALIKSARVAATIHRAGEYGVGSPPPQVDFPAVMARVRDVIAQIAPHDSIERYTSLGVEVLTGYARLTDPWSVEIALDKGGHRRLTARNIVIATGAQPFVPPLPGIEGSGYLTSETMWDAFSRMDAPPERLIIMGGGPIGCELAQAMQRLGSQVTLVEMAGRLLGKEDLSAAQAIHDRLKAEGVDLRLGHQAVRVEDGKLVTRSAKGEEMIPYDALIVAVGRRARVEGFGLKELGLLDDGELRVDGFLATRYSHIFVAGDVAGNQQLTHGASHEAWHAAVNALASPWRKFRADYRFLPRVTYTDPEVASIGLTEEQARIEGIAHEVTRYDLDGLDRAIAEGETQGFVKLLTRPGKDKLLGVTIVGSHAGEMLGQFTLAMKHGLGLGKIMATIAPYPTWGEAGKFAAGEYRKARQPKRLLALAERYFRWRRG